MLTFSSARGTFSPSGIEDFFEEALEPTLDPTEPPPDNVEEVAARILEVGPRYGIEFLIEDSTPETPLVAH